MKKLDLKILKLDKNNVLQRGSLKAIMGGGYVGNCADSCSSDSDCLTNQECMCLDVAACRDINSPVARCVTKNI
ncbi:hypothetical protein HCG49_13910 [Arenibacter sp. 6A1]|uniref:hypothetical protein n=1 Tax=Arenibacter sp. 6A1 TaxID=2720391 RepID=UPI0014462B95|nr:hypothetical protein [Arenibacter sp. 6A1]NKI27660.1 hypothetical protein [Arenibacter sp. 6A1]